MRVVVAAEDVFMRAGVATVLGGAGFDVTAQAGSTEALLRAVIEHLRQARVA